MTDGNFEPRIFGERDAERVAQAIGEERTDTDGGLDAGVFAFAGFGHAEV